MKIVLNDKRIVNSDLCGNINICGNTIYFSNDQDYNFENYIDVLQCDSEDIAKSNMKKILYGFESGYNLVRIYSGKQYNNTTLKDFVEKYVTQNTLLRLWYQYETGNKMIVNSDKKETFMNWELLQGKCYWSKFNDYNFIGVTDIVCETDREAVNIVIDYKED